MGSANETELYVLMGLPGTVLGCPGSRISQLEEHHLL